MDVQGDTEGDKDIVTYKDKETEKETDQKDRKSYIGKEEKKIEKKTKKKRERVGDTKNRDGDIVIVGERD
jgi:hypothetical protein